MTEIMQAVRFHGKTDIRLESIAIPKCGKDQVKVGIARLKISTSTSETLIADISCAR